MRGLYISKDSQVSPGLLTLTARLATENDWFTSHRVPGTQKEKILFMILLIIILQVKEATLFGERLVKKVEEVEEVEVAVVSVATLASVAGQERRV